METKRSLITAISITHFISARILNQHTNRRSHCQELGSLIKARREGGCGEMPKQQGWDPLFKLGTCREQGIPLQGPRRKSFLLAARVDLK